MKADPETVGSRESDDRISKDCNWKETVRTNWQTFSGKMREYEEKK